MKSRGVSSKFNTSWCYTTTGNICGHGIESEWQLDLIDSEIGDQLPRSVPSCSRSAESVHRHPPVDCATHLASRIDPVQDCLNIGLQNSPCLYDCIMFLTGGQTGGRSDRTETWHKVFLLVESKVSKRLGLWSAGTWRMKKSSWSMGGGV